MTPGRNYLVSDARAALLVILREQATTFAEAAASWTKDQQSAQHSMQIALQALRNGCGLLQLKRSSVYCASAQAVLRQAARSRDRDAAARLLLSIGQTLDACTALWSSFPAAAEKAAAGLVGIHSLNRLRAFLGRKALEPAADEEMLQAFARLAAVTLRDVLTREQPVAGSSLIRSLLESHGHVLSSGQSARTVLSQALVAGIGDSSRVLARLTFPDANPMAPSSLRPPALYRVVCCANELRQVAVIAGLPLLHCFAQMPAPLVWHLLRRTDRCAGACISFLLELMRLLEFLVPLELQVQGSDPVRMALPDADPTVVLIARQRMALLIDRADRQVELDDSQARLLRRETELAMREFSAFARDVRQAECVVPARLCTRGYKLALNMATAGLRSSWEKCASLQSSMNLMLEQHARAGEPLACILEEFVQQFPLALQPQETVCPYDALDHHLLLLECAAMQPLMPGQQHSAGAQPHGGQNELPLYLASNIRLLPRAADSLGAVFQEAATPPAHVQSLLAPLQRELQLLSTGARTLKVYRVEALAAALLEVYQQGLQASDTCSDPHWRQLVLRSHRQLRAMLNQAAAHQEVKSARPLIAALYHWLEKASQPGEDDWQLYRMEARQLLQTIASGMLRLKASSDDRGQVDAAALAAAAPGLLGALHTLKGSAALHDEHALVHVCHEAETQLLALVSNSVAYPWGRLENMLESLASCSAAGRQARAEHHVAEGSAGERVYDVRSVLARRKIPVANAALQRFGAVLEVCMSNQQRLARLCVGVDAAPSMPSAMRETLAVQARQLDMLQKLLLNVRQARADRLYRRCARLVAKVANAENRQVRFELRGGELLMEMALLDYLQEPLEHLLRNAICHGIEPAEVRRSKGKPETGLILLELTVDPSALLLTLSDDGGGIDAEEAGSRARKLGLEAGQGAAATSQGIDASGSPGLHWLFVPGFSMQAEVNTTAGRGIGLDAVQRAMEAIGAGITVRSEPGCGTCFTLRVPPHSAATRISGRSHIR